MCAQYLSTLVSPRDGKKPAQSSETPSAAIVYSRPLTIVRSDVVFVHIVARLMKLEPV